MAELDRLPSSNTYVVKHAYFYIAFNLLMAEFEHKKGGTITIKRRIGYRTRCYKQILNIRWEPVYKGLY